VVLPQLEQLCATQSSATTISTGSARAIHVLADLFHYLELQSLDQLLPPHTDQQFLCVDQRQSVRHQSLQQLADQQFLCVDQRQSERHQSLQQLARTHQWLLHIVLQHLFQLLQPLSQQHQ
jgi:hypothetical protein